MAVVRLSYMVVASQISGIQIPRQVDFYGGVAQSRLLSHTVSV